jgi:hypothetical protein
MLGDTAGRSAFQSAARMHAGAAPGGGFTDDQLRAWAGRVRALRRAGKETYV